MHDVILNTYYWILEGTIHNGETCNFKILVPQEEVDHGRVCSERILSVRRVSVLCGVSLHEA